MKPRDGLYHKDVYMPRFELALPRVLPLSFTWHARQAASTDRFGAIKLPRQLDATQAELVELEVRFGRPVKLVVRTKHSLGMDLVLVIALDWPKFVVKTVWLNKADDKHETLQRQVYVQKNA